MRIKLSSEQAQKIIYAQFPEYTNLPVTEVEQQGWDNITFHVGDTLLAKFPSGPAYAPKIQKEETWLPFLARHLTTAITQQVHTGKPCEAYPFPWALYTWIDGKSANICMPHELDMNTIAQQLAQFLQQLHTIPTAHAPTPGLHNHYRGAHPRHYEEEFLQTIPYIAHLIDQELVMNIWNRAMKSEWSAPDVWIHGDIAPGNFLIKDQQLHAVIDFGGMGIGDPACDLTIAWTFFDINARELFKHTLNLDDQTWHRAQAWGLWKASLMLYEAYTQSQKDNIATQQHIIKTIYMDHI